MNTVTSVLTILVLVIGLVTVTCTVVAAVLKGLGYENTKVYRALLSLGADFGKFYLALKGKKGNEVIEAFAILQADQPKTVTPIPPPEPKA
jgi:hypothetical protein